MKQFLEQRGLVGEKEVSAYAPTELFFLRGFILYPIFDCVKKCADKFYFCRMSNLRQIHNLVILIVSN